MVNSQIQRGSLYLYNAGTNNGSIQGGYSRPCVILQENNSKSPTTIIAPLTSVLKKTDMYAHVVLGKRFGLRENSMVLLEQIRIINQDDLGPYIGHIDDPLIIRQIDQGLCKTLGIHSRSCHTCSSSSEEVRV
ncbi:MAG: type II toxin-antitoxin system PemK/MazF family toxin [Butyrivibrio sp.]|nr:type II toxin-antitoxin system PemK/MazF family toxin [Butyrivibrio sp.]